MRFNNIIPRDHLGIATKKNFIEVVNGGWVGVGVQCTELYALLLAWEPMEQGLTRCV